MTYIIGDKTISFKGDMLSSEEKQLTQFHPQIFKYLLNSKTHKYLLNMKKIVHLFSDIVTIYSTLISKIPDYDDITLMTNKTKTQLTRLEEDFISIFGKSLEPSDAGWEEYRYESSVKVLTVMALKSCCEAFDAVYKNLNCIDLFFNSFDNLRKLLIPSLLTHTQMIQKLIMSSLFLFGLTTIVDEIPIIRDVTPAVFKQLSKIDSITTGIERESKLLQFLSLTIDTSLSQYTKILLGKAILKQDIDDASCCVIERRDICFQAAESVVSIPLNVNQSPQTYEKHFIYFISAIFLVVIAVLYSLFIANNLD